MIFRLLIAALFAGLCSSAANAQTFLGYPCTVDCSGHEAGYEWADENGVSDSFGCNTPSNSFNEGCEAFVEEQESGSYGSQWDEEEGEEDDGQW